MLLQVDLEQGRSALVSLPDTNSLWSLSSTHISFSPATQVLIVGTKISDAAKESAVLLGSSRPCAAGKPCTAASRSCASHIVLPVSALMVPS